MKVVDFFIVVGWDFEGEINNGNDEIWCIVDSVGIIFYFYLFVLIYDVIGVVLEVNLILGLDILLFIVVCMDIIVYLDVLGEANIMLGDIGVGSMISCDILMLLLF